MVDVVGSNIQLYVDDVTLYLEVNDPVQAIEILNTDLRNIED